MDSQDKQNQQEHLETQVLAEAARKAAKAWAKAHKYHFTPSDTVVAAAWTEFTSTPNRPHTEGVGDKDFFAEKFREEVKRLGEMVLPPFPAEDGRMTLGQFLHDLCTYHHGWYRGFVYRNHRHCCGRVSCNRYVARVWHIGHAFC